MRSALRARLGSIKESGGQALTIDTSPFIPPAPAATAAPAPAIVVSNPLTWLVDFIGSANVQKVLGMLQVYIGGATAAEGKTLGAHITGMTIGSAFTLGVHLVDALRAKIGR